MRYRVTRRIAWATPAQEKKRRAGKPCNEKRANVGKTLDESELAGADVDWLVAKGALEPVVEDGDA